MTTTAKRILALRQPAGLHPDIAAGRVEFKAKSLADAIDYAREVLASADNLDLGDPLAVIRSQASLDSTLRWILRALDEDTDSRDRAAEDGHRFVGVPFQRGPVAA
ncbi:hypothetical protein ACIFUY_06790 [Streptomyces sp. CACIS-1.16CA]|uniref:hypothetical protein n=1 Tax=Streptomyces sp. CACIS-1.16CA TaxID=1175510 RepID=UPI0037D09A2B